MIILDYRDTRPLYEQIVDKFQMLILSGALEPNSRMPSVRSLAVELSINPNTIQRAYSELERNGFLYTVKGKGNYVAYSDSLKDVRKQEILEKLRDLKKEALSMGMTVKELTEFLEQEDTAAAGQKETK
ncbi:GntR family transcriptional regulator, partial [Gallintestinimicrobium sp.]